MTRIQEILAVDTFLVANGLPHDELVPVFETPEELEAAEAEAEEENDDISGAEGNPNDR